MNSPAERPEPARYRSPLLLSATDSLLLFVDVQDKLLALIRDELLLRWNLGRLGAGANVLDVPCLATEQYPEKLGPTTASVLNCLQSGANEQGLVPAKMSFSGAACDTLFEQLAGMSRRQVVVVGLETHVCVLQTALDLIAAGYDVYVVVDAVGARFDIDHQTALRRLESAGVTLITAESVLFEWCERAGTPEFKQISSIVRQPRPERP